MSPEEFKKIRKAARLTQAQMAEHLGVSRKTVVNWENEIFSIPDNALDTLTEKGVSPVAGEAAPVTLKSHPHLFSNFHGKIRQRNHQHPHWWTLVLRNYMTDAQKAVADAIVTTTADLETVWTPERAVVFTMAFVGKSRVDAENICRGAGFDVPMTETAHSAYQQDWARYQEIHPGGGWRDFEEMFPQHREHKATREPTAEETAESLRIQQALNSAFNLNHT